MVYICSCIHDSKVLEDVTRASIVSRVGPNVAWISVMREASKISVSYEFIERKNKIFCPHPCILLFANREAVIPKERGGWLFSANKRECSYNKQFII